MDIYIKKNKAKLWKNLHQMIEGVFNHKKRGKSHWDWRPATLMSKTKVRVTLNAIHMSHDQRIETDLHLQSVKTEE